MKLSVTIATVLALALAGWIASPYVFSNAAEQDGSIETQSLERSAKEQPLFRVRTQLSAAESVSKTVVSHGETAPARRVDIRAEIEGRVLRLPADRGSQIDEGQVLIEIDPREKQQMLNQAQATLEQRRIEYEAARKLGKRGFQAETAVAKAKADLEMAKAMLEQEIIRLGHTQMKAPFSGVLEHRPVEVGDFLKVGDLAASILELDPLIVTTDLPESAGSNIEVGMPGTAVLVSGETVTGTLRYVAHEASGETRTFRVELKVSNPDGNLPAGVSATLRLDLDQVDAHRLSSSLLSLDDEGRIGIKIVDDDNRVRFHEAVIVKSDPKSVWLADLPPEVQVINVGQGFVRDGQEVEAIAAESVEQDSVETAAGRNDT